jgi:predicted Zn-dependent protease
MAKKFITTILLCVVFIIISCHRNAITGRSQLSLVSEAEIQNMAVQQYRQFLSSSKVVASTGSKDAEMVKRVGDRIIKAITAYYAEKGLSNELAGYQWEVNLVNKNEVNAWCMPGGKIVVYTGILPVTQNEPALAVVMGHEIAHALARHGNERMSQGLLQQFGGTALSVALSSKPAETQNLYMAAYGLASQVGGILPFNRKNELEADKLGLMFSALAGYNPNEAIPFWKRMGALSNGQKPPEFLSTHPSDERRVEELSKIMDDVITKYYKPISTK